MANTNKNFTGSVANNPYSGSGGLIQSASQDAPPAEKVDGCTERKKPGETYRFNAKLPIECKAYLQEMAWRNRTDMNAYLSRIALEDMERHPEWTQTVDILNTADSPNK